MGFVYASQFRVSRSRVYFIIQTYLETTQEANLSQCQGMSYRQIPD
jgi:hypothetical protein